MDEPPVRPHRGPLRTADAARESGYSPQQVRDLERLGVIPSAARSDNGYRCYTAAHVHALRSYRGLAAAVGPVAARAMLPELRTATLTEAASAVSALHVRLAREREEALRAQEALLAVRAEAGESAFARESDAMTITELAGALGVRPSALRFWEQEGLLTPERVTSLRARRYGLPAIRTARIVAALRSAGYGVPEVRDIVGSLDGLAGFEETRRLLGDRLDRIAARSVALLRAGADLAAVVMAEQQPPQG
ncbi:MerR family DNA-binding transcriptional regulator [Streptomyces spongiicola]|uniref:MerR family DNA-binding transcriptional regulator n=1 Tax=Streptomyces spongiicola TaxID=1690221 RepID=A0A388ST31_9ACTN|nr:MerR family transcriptional regulator [Streptomyces spongiicola]GBP99605.1 MerR family DNA-binding transcriptional regulator [Streptomyces spongiicola]